ncbi:MAG: c-type cytochrome [Acidobacteria bacterium]|nr:c-type cytochrome [Acidobacteriota bacterium]
MRLSVRLFAVAVFVTSTFARGIGQDASPARTWPPGVQPVGEASPALSPADALKTFSLPPGYRLELVAAEPLVQDPTVIDWDLEGRLWVVEMTGFVRTLDAPEPNLDPIGRVVVLEDTNHDGRMDRRTVFADGLAVPRGVKVLDDGVLVAEPGILWWMRDTNHDLRADVKDIVTREYGRREGSVEGNANGLYWGLDNWLHTSGAEIDLRRRNGRFEIRRIPLRGEWGVTQDDAGRMYRNTNESALHVDVVPAEYYARHASLLRTRGLYESLAIDNDALNDVWPVRPTPGTNRAYQLGIDRPDGTLARFTAVCAPLIYRGDRLPAELYGNAFVAEPAANLVSRLVLSDTGALLRAEKAYARAEFIASTDERFRPVYLANAPDGTLYVVDMYRGVIQDKSSTTTYLRDYIVRKQLDTPIGLGRIYRVVHDTTRRAEPTGLATASASALVKMLSHPNAWWRETAQRLIVERRAVAVASDLAALASTAGDWRTRLHALWTLEGLDRLAPDVVVRALDDRSREVRASALRLAERWLADPRETRVRDAVRRRVADDDWMVRQQVAASLGAMPGADKARALADVLSRYGTDPIIVDVALSGAAGSELAIADELLAGSDTPARSAAVTMLAATVARSGREEDVTRLFDRIASASLTSWSRTALLRGAEVALIGGALPGTAARRGGPPAPAPPCPTCPGARGGPGGSYAFPGVREAQQAATSAPAAGRGSAPLRLRAAPQSLTTLAIESPDPLAPRAAALLGRVEWPGKLAGGPSSVAGRPLTAVEQARFERGREVYRNACQACHQPDGRGQDRLAPPLVGSAIAFADSRIPVRVLLNGKEGAIGLMPPLGATMTDADVSSVLTYIRREWNQAGAPVAPEEVAAVRAETAGRTNPWTDDELTGLMRAAPGR